MPPENVAAVVASMSAILRSRPFISFSSRWILSASSASNSSGIAEATGPPGLTGRDRDHRLASQLLGYWPVAQPVLAGGEPVDPRGEPRLALRITQTPHHACHVTSVRETVIDRRAFLPIRVTKPMRATLDGSPVVRSRPGPGTMPSEAVPTGIRAHESRPWN